MSDSILFDTPTLRQITHDLITASKPGEDVFLALGRNLSEAVKIIGHLSKGIDRLIGTSEGERIVHTADQLRSAATRVIDITTALSEEGQALLLLSDTLEKGSKTIAQLRRTISEVAILGINAKIHVAQIVGSIADFTVFTSEIARLAGIAGEGLEEMERNHLGITQLIRQAKSGQEKFSKTQGVALSEVGRRIQHSMDLFIEYYRQSRTVISSIGDRSAQIAKLVGEAVVALQVNDVTRQRIEHCAEAMKIAANLLDENSGGRLASITIDVRHKLAAVISRLQSLQLVKAAEHFETEVNRLLETLKSLADDTSQILQDELAIVPKKENETLFSSLRDELQDAQRLYSRFEKAREETRHLIAEVSQSVTQMTAHVEAVHGIEADIRVMGLNATLKCGRLGNQGRALVVIAQELRQCANRTREQARGVSQGLQELMEAATSLSQLDVSRVGNNGISIGDAITDSIALTEDQETFEQKLQPLVHDTQYIKELLEEATRTTDIHHTMSGTLRRIAQKLWENSTFQCPADEQKALVQQALGLLDSNYTMASEREIHALFLDGVPSGELIKTEEIESVDDLLF